MVGSMTRLLVTIIASSLLVACGSSGDDFYGGCTRQVDFEVCLAAGRTDGALYGPGEFDSLLTYSYFTPKQTPLGDVEKISALWLVDCIKPLTTLTSLQVYLSNGGILEHYPGFSEEYTNEDLEPMAVGLESEWQYAMTEACEE